jgi:hypothetical protein
MNIVRAFAFDGKQASPFGNNRITHRSAGIRVAFEDILCVLYSCRREMLGFATIDYVVLLKLLRVMIDDRTNVRYCMLIFIIGLQPQDYSTQHPDVHGIGTIDASSVAHVNQVLLASACYPSRRRNQRRCGS